MGASFSVDDRSDYSDLLHLEGDRLVEAAFCGHGGLFAVGTRKPDGHGQIVQPSSHRADGTLRKQIAGQPSDLLCIDGEIWISEIDGSSIQRFDTPGLRELSAVEGVGSGVIAMAEDWDAVYALSSGRHASATWTRIALESREVGPRVPAGRCPSDIAVGAGYIWVTSLCAKELLRFDPAGRLRGSLPLPSGPTTVHSHFGLLWVGTRTEMLYIDPERLSIIGSKNMRGKVRAMIVGGERLWTLFGYSRLRKLPLEVPE
ncbi:MAG: hypothetical protein QOG04_1745 [Actinomycetota bacterium]|nr:hypothetical protein [Actinomycetota bacterium]